jgi:(1->4)-alpha-D-glucan 1-alpha-D-glucosylmutase
MLKAVREAKLHTSWLTPNSPMRRHCRSFVARVLEPRPNNASFLRSPLLRQVGAIGMLNSLSQVVVKLGSPGVPDFYQGSELWDLSLVDPDNRRPWTSSGGGAAGRRRSGAGLCPASAWRRWRTCCADWTDGRIKLLTTTAGLALRRNDPELFLSGGYLPLATESPSLAMPSPSRGSTRTRAQLFVAPRLCARLFTADSAAAAGRGLERRPRVLVPRELAAAEFRHVLTGAEIRADEHGR